MLWYDVDLRWAYGDLLGSIYNRTRSIDGAYDVLHDALVRLALASRRSRIVQPHAYLQTVVRSVLADHHRAMARWLPFPGDDDVADGAAHPDLVLSRRLIAETLDAASVQPSPEHLASLRERVRALERVLDALPPRCREIFWLFRIDGLTQPAIAAQLGITVKTVEYHLKRALVDLLAASEELT